MGRSRLSFKRNSKLSFKRNSRGKRKRSPLPNEDRYYESSTSSNTTICVRNMPPTFFQHDVNNMFQKYGHLRSVNVVNDNNNNNNNNNNGGRIAFVEFENRHDAKNAFKSYDKTIVRNHLLKLRWHISDEEADVEIMVGDEEEIETFKAQSSILKARSLYFNVALSGNWVKRSENGTILFEKKNISPDIFALLLVYFSDYTMIDGLKTEVEVIIDLLVACDELLIHELLGYLQKHLIKRKNEWLHRNLNRVHEISSKCQLLRSLRSFCNKLIKEEPEYFLKSNDIAILEKSMLVSILKRDDLTLEEINIWNYVVQWGIGQDEEASEKNISEWADNDFKKLKMLLEDIIPLIRFHEISINDFNEKIEPYKKIIDEKIYEDIFFYFPYERQYLFKTGARSFKKNIQVCDIK